MDHQLLLDLWRETGRQAALADSMATITATLARVLPFEAMRIDEISETFTDLITLAEWDREEGVRRQYHALNQRVTQLRTLARWAERRSTMRTDGHNRWQSPLEFLQAFTAGRPGHAGALVVNARCIGVLGLRLPEGRRLSEEESQLFEAALEPLAAAVANDVRQRELQRLRMSEPERHDAPGKPAGEIIIGADRGLANVMERVEQVAKSGLSVLILGETGAGKEVIARAIHERSPRRDKPFLRVNCGAIPPELIDSQLFGHERGSFTGAIDTHRGWFERADGGTLFLDEIGDLALPAQVRLLRVLQDGVLQRVGSEKEISVDVRVIAATHRDLPSMVQDGSFREDLWYRIATFPIILPPLRERREDLPELARHFIRRAANRLGVHVPPLNDGDLATLVEYDWPGNVRELVAVLERAVVLGGGERLALDIALGTTLAPQPARKTATPANATSSDERPMPLDEVLRNHIEKALRFTRGRIDGPGGAAEILAINPSTLRARLRKLGVDPNDFRDRRRHDCRLRAGRSNAHGPSLFQREGWGGISS